MPRFEPPLPLFCYSLVAASSKQDGGWVEQERHHQERAVSVIGYLSGEPESGVPAAFRQGLGEKALGITFPLTLLGRADKVIE